ncbi:MFS transporter [Clostridium tyrobutyricum]|jgi:predicted MFS family arabinose efflux permease|uniref:MFS transporter n=1 Tax=Clostridium tyrobutyricum TaxID=1519 RepID=UPI0002F320C5|nr:MFS transporter [Clostridium tyrobutyricum]MEA5008160.1 MFS transporter [Clostridium tyrobutyricum]
MEEKLLNKKFIISLLVLFFINISSMCLMSTIPAYSKTIQNSTLYAGLMTTCFTFAALMVRPFIDKVVKKITMKKTLIYSLVCILISAFGYLFAHNIYELLICRIIHGVGYSFALTCAATICNQSIPKSKLNKGVAFISSTTTISSAVGPTIALNLAGSNLGHFQYVFYLFLGLSLSSLIISYSIKTKTNTFNKKSGHNKIQTKIYIIFVKSCLFFFSQSVINSFLIIYALSKHMGGISLFFTVSAVFSFIGQMSTTFLQEKFGDYKVQIFALFCYAAVLYLISAANTASFIIYLAILYGLAIGNITPIFSFRLLKNIGEANYALGNAMYYASIDFGYGFGALIFGIISGLLGYSAIFIIAAILVVIVALSELVMPKSKNNDGVLKNKVI